MVSQIYSISQLLSHSKRRTRDLFNLDTKRIVTEKLYVVKNERGLAPEEESDIQFESFTIPSVQPTTEGFGCIDISYKIRVTIGIFNLYHQFGCMVDTILPVNEKIPLS